MEARKPPATDEDPDIRIVEPVSALATLNKAEIDIQIATARRFPRSVKQFKEQALEMATLDEETAGSMFYALKRDGKIIEGPSARLAEIVGSAFGNLRYQSRVIDVDGRFVTAQGMCFDLEKNVAAAVEVKRRITGKDGRRYSDDMVTVTANAAMSIALRNAVFKVVPFAFVKSIYEVAKQVSLGKGMTMEQRRTKALEWFGKLGVKPEEILKLLDRRGVDDISMDDLTTLRGLRNAIHEGETTVDEAFKDVRQQPATPGAEGSKLDTLAAALAKAENGTKSGSGTAAPATGEAQQTELGG